MNLDPNIRPSLADPALPARAAPARRERSVEEPIMLQVVTLVLWLACLGIGMLGLLIPYPRPHPPVKQEEPTQPVQAELIKVELAQAPPLDAPPPDPSEPPQELPSAPPLPAVALPSPAIAFAIPVEGPVTVVDAKYASAGRPVRAAMPVAKRITYGLGEGAQPAPQYPQEAVAAGEQGAVGVRFSVGEDGRVLAVTVISPCPWPLLNQSVASTILYSWRFGPGPRRLYEITLTFRLNQL